MQSFVVVAFLCVVFFFFFQIARGSPFYTLRFSNICLQGDVSVPNRWPSFYTRTILPTLKGPSTYITCLWTLWNSSLYMNSVYSKDLSGCGECQLWHWLIFNYRRLFCTQLLYSWLLFFSPAFNWSWNSMTYFVWRECILYLCLLRRWPWA